jgi:hypothetical protein
MKYRVRIYNEENELISDDIWYGNSIENVKFWVDLAIRDIVQKLNDKQYSGDTPMWNLPIVGRNDQVRYGQCSTADVDIFNDVDVATKNNYKTWFCKMYQILQPKGYTLKGYFYITPIFAQN